MSARLRAFLEAGPRWFPPEPPVPWPARAQWGRAVVVLLAILAVTAALYARIVSLPFLSEAYIDLPFADKHSPTVFLFTSSYLEVGGGLYYRPGWRAIDWAVQRILPGGRAPAANYAFQLAQHLACVSLVFSLVFAMTGFRIASSAASALILALHPSISAAVVNLCARWSIDSVLVFLLYVNVVEWTFVRHPAKAPRWVFLALSPLLLFLALISEIGALAMGIAGLWVCFRLWQRGGQDGFLRCLLPLAWVPIAYLIFRRIAIGSIAGSYAQPAGTGAGRWRLLAHHAFNDVLLLLEPLSRAFASSTAILALCLALLFLSLGPQAARRAFRANPCALLGVAVFFLFQVNALWTAPVVPIRQAGINYGYVYYLAAAFCAIIVGQFVRAACDGGKVPRILVGSALFLWFFASGIQTHQALDLWMKAGRLVQRHEAQLHPVLSQLPDGAAVHLQGFPEALRAPHLPWALAYRFTAPEILRAWSGKRLKVTWDLKDGNPAQFSGLLLRESGERLEVVSIGENQLAGRWAAHVASRAASPPPFIMDPARAYLSAIAVEPAPDGARLRLEGSDPSMSFAATLNPVEYGYLRGEVLLEALAGNASPELQFYFAEPGIGFSEANSITVPLKAQTGVWQRIELPLYSVPAWALLPNVERVRLDPLNGAAVMRVRGLELSASGS